MVKVISNSFQRHPIYRCLNKKCNFRFLGEKMVIGGICPKCGGDNVEVASWRI